MNRSAFCFVIPVLALILALPALARADGSDGPGLFKEAKCIKCHTVNSAQIERSEAVEKGQKPAPDLSGTGNAEGIDADWLSKWLDKKEKSKNGKKHPAKYKGSDDDKKILIDWMLTLKEGEAPHDLYKKAKAE